MKVTTGKRNTYIESLRIISMFLIVLSHYTVHNGVDNYTLPLGFNRWLLEFSALGGIGVVIFVLITGYYCINKDHPFKLKRLLSMVFQVLFYSLIIYLVFVFLGMEKFSMTDLLKNFLPITFRRYWFMSVFVLLYILTPYINLFLNKINRKQHLHLMLLLLVLFSIFPTFTLQSFYGNELIQFIMFYIIGAYLGKYNDNFFSKKKNCLIILMLSVLVLASSIIVLDLLGIWFPFFAQHSNLLLGRNTIVSIMIAVSVFSLFNMKKPFTNKLINGVAACVLGVYLISDNYLIRGVLWTNILNVSSHVNGATLIIHMIVSVVMVFAVCSVIEFIRLHTVERVFSVFYDAIEKKVVSWRRNRRYIDCVLPDGNDSR